MIGPLGDDTGYYGKPIFVVDCAARETLFEDDAGTNIAEVGDRVVAIRDAAGSGKMLIANTPASACFLREEADGTRYLEGDTGYSNYALTNSGLSGKAGAAVVTTARGGGTGTTNLILVENATTFASEHSFSVYYSPHDDRWVTGLQVKTGSADYFLKEATTAFSGDVVVSTAFNAVATATFVMDYVIKQFRIDSVTEAVVEAGSLDGDVSIDGWDSDVLSVMGRQTDDRDFVGRLYYLAIYDYEMGPEMLLKAEQVAYSRLPTQGDFTTTPLKRAEPQPVTVPDDFYLTADSDVDTDLHGAKDFAVYFKGNVGDLTAVQTLAHFDNATNHKFYLHVETNGKVSLSIDGTERIRSTAFTADTDIELFMSYDQATGTTLCYSGDTSALDSTSPAATGLSAFDSSITDVTFFNNGTPGEQWNGESVERFACWVDASVDIASAAGRDLVRQHLRSETLIDPTFQVTREGLYPENQPGANGGNPQSVDVGPAAVGRRIYLLVGNATRTTTVGARIDGQNMTQIHLGDNPYGTNGRGSGYAWYIDSDTIGGVVDVAVVQSSSNTGNRVGGYVYSSVGHDPDASKINVVQSHGDGTQGFYAGPSEIATYEGGALLGSGFYRSDTVTGGTPALVPNLATDLSDDYYIGEEFNTAEGIRTVDVTATENDDHGYLVMAIKPAYAEPVFDLYGDLDKWKTGRFPKV